MGEKQAWVNVPMTDEEVNRWLRVRDRGFARFALRYGVIVVGVFCVVLLTLHFVLNPIDRIPENLRKLPLHFLFSLPVLGPFMAYVVCGITWRLWEEKYRNTLQQLDGDTKQGSIGKKDGRS